MIGFLRFVGILNAAAWCGSAIFILAGLPAVFSPELKRLLTPAGTGFAAEAIIARYFAVQYVCGVIALAHLAAEWLYAGRPARRLDVGLVTVLLTLAVIGGAWAQPKMRDLHAVKYFGKTKAAQEEAAKTFALWHGISETVNLFVICGLVVYLTRVSASEDHARFGAFPKIRG